MSSNSRYPLRNRRPLSAQHAEENPVSQSSSNDDVKESMKVVSLPISSTPSMKRRRAAVGPPKRTSSPQQPAIVTPSSKTEVKDEASDSAHQKGKKRKTKAVVPPPHNKNPPKGWEEIYSLVEELRQDKSAPVDSDGAEALPNCQDRDSKNYRFQVLMALMLSSQTKDAVVGQAMANLQEYGLTVQAMHEISSEKLNQLIHKVGFHNNKTKYIQQTAAILLDQHDGDIPKTAKEMMELPGIGPKMAFLIETIAWGTTSGIGIDTHMHRMFNQLKWVQSKTPEQTRVQLEAWLPRERWSTVNYLWVGFGQEVQQQKPKMLQKVLSCSRPKDALHLVKRLGLDYQKEGAKLGLEQAIRQALTTDIMGSSTSSDNQIL